MIAEAMGKALRCDDLRTGVEAGDHAILALLFLARGALPHWTQMISRSVGSGMVARLASFMNPLIVAFSRHGVKARLRCLRMTCSTSALTLST